jgi:RNA recognition motif-containing protein
MSKVLYVGNLDQDVNADALRALFAQHGSVERAEPVKKKSTGKCRGFGFVHMRSEQDAQAAIEGLNGAELLGSKIIVAEAKPTKYAAPREYGGRPDRDRGPRGGGGYRGGPRSDSRSDSRPPRQEG